MQCLVFGLWIWLGLSDKKDPFCRYPADSVALRQRVWDLPNTGIAGSPCRGETAVASLINFVKPGECWKHERCFFVTYSLQWFQEEVICVLNSDTNN